MNCPEIMNWLRQMQAAPLTAAASKVALAIALRINVKDGICFPSKACLSADTGLSEPTIRRAVAALVKAGLLEVEFSAGRITNRYRLVISGNPVTSDPVEEEAESANPVTSDPVKGCQPPPTPSPVTGDPVTSDYRNKQIEQAKKESLSSGKCPTREREVSLSDVEEVIGHLNAKAGTAFEVRNRDGKLTSGAEAARQRVAEHGLDKIKAVIDQKATEWLGTERSIYLRPATLFRRSNAENYVGQLGLKPPPAPCPRGGYAPPEPSGAAYRPFTFD